MMHLGSLVQLGWQPLPQPQLRLRLQLQPTEELLLPVQYGLTTEPGGASRAEPALDDVGWRCSAATHGCCWLAPLTQGCCACRHPLLCLALCWPGHVPRTCCRRVSRTCMQRTMLGCATMRTKRASPVRIFFCSRTQQQRGRASAAAVGHCCVGLRPLVACQHHCTPLPTQPCCTSPHLLLGEAPHVEEHHLEGHRLACQLVLRHVHL